MCIKNLEKCNKIMHVAKRNVILLYFSKLQIQYATNFYMNLFHIIDTYTVFFNFLSFFYWQWNIKCAIIGIVNTKCGCGGTGRRAGLRNQCQRRGGSSPFIRTNDVSVRTKLEQRDTKINQKIKSGWFFCCLKTILKSSKWKDGV